MPITRTFLDWSQPALPQVVQRLREEFTVLGTCDLSGVILVFPGQQAGRRFSELLTLETSGQASPPTVITVGQLPELLYEPQRPFASQLTQRLAWAEALRSLPRDKLQKILSDPPSEHDVEAWLKLGELLSRQHRELAADLLSFSDVAQRGPELEGFNESERWTILAEVQTHYLESLDRFELWDQQTARLVAIRQCECRTDNRIVLVGAVDVNLTLRAMLDQVADHVTALVHAPRRLQQRFDGHGCLIPDKWADPNIDLDPDQVTLVDGPPDQAEAVVRQLAGFGGRYAMEDLTICVPDDRIVPHLRRTLGQFDVPTRWVIGGLVQDSAPYRLLSAVADYLETGRVDLFSELIRHPDLSAWLNEQGLPQNWLTLWDENRIQHLQRTTNAILGQRDDAHVSRKLVATVNAALEPLARESRPLSDWAEPITELLLHVYGHVEFDREDSQQVLVLDACAAIHKACVGQTSLPEQLQPIVSASPAIRLILDQIRTEILTNSSTAEAVTLSGWLDLPLDDAPVAIVTTFNEGVIPSSVNHDLFLPNRLRTHLGIEDNDRRFARDAYALSVLVHSREELRLIVGRRDTSGDPSIPSRLLFATDPKTIAERVWAFFGGEQSSVSPSVSALLQTNREISGFVIPQPQPPPKPRPYFRVTEFADYLLSPYRYYLRHVLKLQELTDDIDELDPMSFGNLIHGVLEEFGRGPLKDSTDSREITSFLREALDRLVHRTFGVDPVFPARIQFEQIKARLAAFASWQADWRHQGWEVRHVEVGNREPVRFSLDDGRSIRIRGRIDRIDFNPRSGAWAVLDYKTGDGGDHPDKTHRRSGEWVNLQLPLYRHLARPLGVQGDVRLGFVVIPRDTNNVGALIADWTDAQLAEADDVTRRTARNILDNKFWMELERPTRYLQEFDGICQTGVFGREAVV